MSAELQASMRQIEDHIAQVRQHHEALGLVMSDVRDAALRERSRMSDQVALCVGVPIAAAWLGLHGRGLDHEHVRRIREELA